MRAPLTPIVIAAVYTYRMHDVELLRERDELNGRLTETAGPERKVIEKRLAQIAAKLESKPRVKRKAR